MLQEILWQEEKHVREVDVATFSGFTVFSFHFILSYSSTFSIEIAIKPEVIIQMQSDINMHISYAVLYQHAWTGEWPQRSNWQTCWNWLLTFLQ